MRESRRKWGNLRWPLLLLLFSISLLPFSEPTSSRSSQSVIDVEGGPESVVWAVQLSDLHFSVFNPDRAQDFARLVGPALAMINPSLVLITGDLTDGKSKDLLTMKQEEAEWMEYQHVMGDVIRQSRLDEKIFYDLRGNHDSFGVPGLGSAYDFYQNYSLNSRLSRSGRIQSVTLRKSGWKHVFVGFDSTMEVGLRGPTNLFGHPTDKLLADLDAELSQWDAKSPHSQVTKISFGHFPLSFSVPTDTGKSLKDVFLKNSLSAYLCGHLHTRFGKNLKRHHTQPSGKYYQFNIHEGTMDTEDNCSRNTRPVKEFWEWEMGDWRKSRALRIVAIDSGHVSYLDTDFKFGSRDTIIVPTFPLDSRFMQRISSSRDFKCRSHSIETSYETIRALVFSTKVLVSVSVKIYDSMPGSLSLVLDSAMQKLGDEGNRGNLYTAPWNWRAFVHSAPDRYWLQIEALDISGSISYSQLRPFSINGLTFRVNWKWKEFYVMGCQWAYIYQPILWMVLPLLFSLLIIPRAFLRFSKQLYTYNRVNRNSRGKIMRGGVIDSAFWVLMEFSRMTRIWSALLLYLIYLTFFPWIYGHIFTESREMTYMNYRGWSVKDSGDLSYVGVPDVMVIVVPHLCFVVLPTVLVIAAMVSERTAYRTYFHSVSGKKEDDQYRENKRRVGRRSFLAEICFSRWRWLRKFLLLISLAIMWRHGKQCRALVKAYDMNPFLHGPVYCFCIPLLLAYAVYTTSTI